MRARARSRNGSFESVRDQKLYAIKALNEAEKKTGIDTRFNEENEELRQELTPAQIQKRRVRCRQLLNWIIHEGSEEFRFFSDEKMFTVERAVNLQNEQWLARNPKDVPIVGRRKFSQSVQVLSVLSSEGDVMSPYFFGRGQRINAEVYLNVLKPWMDTSADGRITSPSKLELRLTAAVQCKRE